jgi:hypothetical protein
MEIQKKMDTDAVNVISLDEFIYLAYYLIMYSHVSDTAVDGPTLQSSEPTRSEVVDSIFSEGNEGEEEEERPEEFTDLSPEDQTSYQIEGF